MVEFCTIQDAIDDTATVNGDTIEVYPGTYTENAHNWVDIDIYKELNIIGQGGSSGTIIQLNEYNNPAGAHMDGVSISASNVKLQGFTFTKIPSNTYACGFNIRAGINVHTPPPGGIFSNIVLRDVESEYSHGSNVVFDGAYTYQDVVIEDCNIHDSYTERCFYESPSTTIDGLTVIDSSFDNAGFGNPLVGDPIGFNLQGTTIDLHITGGTFNNNPNGGIGMRCVTNAIIKDVTVTNSGNDATGIKSGIGIWEDVSSTSNIDIINPTVTNSGGRGIMFGTWSKTVSDIKIKDGTISGTGNIGCMLYTGGAAGLVTDITLDGVTITNSGSQNFQAYEEDFWGDCTCNDITITGCIITNSPVSGLDFIGINVAGSSVYCNEIMNNAYGISRTTGTGILDAECNWYGDCSGPTHASNPGGIGDAVSDNVDYDPWTGQVTAEANGPYYTEDLNPIQFNSSGSYMPCTCAGETLTYYWDFGDGETSTLENPTHIYTACEDEYTVTLTVTGSITNCFDVDTATAYVDSTLVADAHGHYEGVLGAPVDFHGSATGGVPPYHYYWDFGDCVYSPKQNPSHIYDCDFCGEGEYTVTLTVTDSGCGVATDITVAVIGSPETVVADAGGPY